MSSLCFMRYAGAFRSIVRILPLLSPQNPLLKQVRKAAARGSLTDDGLALAEGPHLLEEALRSGVTIDAVIVSETARQIPDAGVARVIHVAEATFAGLASTETTQGVLALVRPRALEPLPGPALAVVLDGVQDPGNAGAIVRAAEAFRATCVAFLKGSVNPYNPKCLRASAGSLFRVPITHELPDLPLFAAHGSGGIAAASADLRKPCAIVIGSEGRGVSRGIASQATLVTIPTSGVESLNAAVAAGILLYEASRQRANV